MDIGNKGYITEQEFVDGWSRVALTGGSAILRRFSDDLDLTPIRRNRIRSGQRISIESPSDEVRDRVASTPQDLQTADSDIRNVFRAYVKRDEAGSLYADFATFKSIWRQVTGQRGDVYIAMQYFNQFDIGRKGYMQEDEFVDVWLKYAQDSESPILSQFSAESTSRWSLGRRNSGVPNANDESPR